jgi:tRNA 2-thiouridine synthesizing protein B
MLHIISASPFESSAWSQCAAFLQAQDAVLFIADGVYTLPLLSFPFGCALYALIDDAKLRGIKIPEGISLVDYSGMVALTEQQTPIMTWSR